VIQLGVCQNHIEPPTIYGAHLVL